MSKKVVVISASPRKGGNSDVLCDQFVQGAQEAGHTVKKIFLRDKQINYCTGCGVCNTTHKCVLRDDMADILPQLVDSDVIVLATPIYFYSMNGQLKTFIDRCVPRYREMTDKDFYYIIAAEDNDKQLMQRAIEGLRGFAEDCLPNSHERGIVYGIGAWHVGEIKDKPAMQEAYELGKNV